MSQKILWYHDWIIIIFLETICRWYFHTCNGSQSHLSKDSQIYSQTLTTQIYYGLFQKKSKQGGWGYGISRGIKEITCGIPRDQLKMKWNFQGWPRKNNVKFLGVFVFGLRISKGSDKILWNIQGLSFVLSWNSRVK